MTAANWYYYNKNGEKIGPISVAALKALVQQRLVTRDTVIANHTGRTVVAGDVRGLIFPEPSTPPTASDDDEAYGFSFRESTKTPPQTMEPNPFSTMTFVEDDPFTAPKPVEANPFTAAMPHSAAHLSNGKATTSLILGCVGLLAWIIPLFGLPITITGLVMGIKGNSKAGTVLCIIGLLLTVINASIGAYKGATGQLF